MYDYISLQWNEFTFTLYFLVLNSVQNLTDVDDKATGKKNTNSVSLKSVVCKPFMSVHLNYII